MRVFCSILILAALAPLLACVALVTLPIVPLLFLHVPAGHVSANMGRA
jgi:hypothetical protein